MHRQQAIKEIIAIMGDGSRSDRYLRFGWGEGQYITTPDLNFLEPSGEIHTPPFVRIPFVDSGATAKELRGSALALVMELEAKQDADVA
jgi:hypothetical protein